MIINCPIADCRITFDITVNETLPCNHPVIVCRHHYNKIFEDFANELEARKKERENKNCISLTIGNNNNE